MIAVALAATAMAGCVENPLTAMSTDAEVSAFENKKLADEAALDWNENAALIGVIAFELTESDEPNVVADPEVGNGLAPAWWFVYCATDSMKEWEGEEEETSSMRTMSSEEEMASMGSMVRAFKVTADGTVTSEQDAEAMAMGFQHEMATTVDKLDVDSSDALATAKTDETFRAAAEGFNASVIEGVANHEGVNAWWFAAMSADGFVVATVDAATGELLEVTPIDMDVAIPEFEFGARDPETWIAEPVLIEAEGVAEPGAEPFEAPFYAGDKMHGTLVIDFDTMWPTDGLHWAILDSEGEIVEVDHVRSWMGGSSYEIELALDEPGDYTFTLYYMSWAPTPIGTPLESGVAYSLVLDLQPGEMEHEEDDH